MRYQPRKVNLYNVSCFVLKYKSISNNKHTYENRKLKPNRKHIYPLLKSFCIVVIPTLSQQCELSMT